MLRIREERREPTRRTERRRTRPRIEGLEDRLLLFATNGGEWVFPERITFSFAPDGTDVGGSPSMLDAAMSDRGISAGTWRDQFRKAFAGWQAAANINFDEVPDDGTMLSDSGNQQNDPRFGDIRIAGYDLGSGILGMAFLPPALNGGTIAGDILLNTTAIWSINSTYDVMTVAVHEIGHALGLGHSDAASTVMGYVYNGVQQSLKTDDVNGIRSIYDARQPDAFEGPAGNNTYFRASNLNSQINAEKQIRLGNLDIQSAGDQDWFYVNVPAGASTQMTVTMQSSDLSLLAPRLQVYSSSLRGLADVSGAAYGGTATATLNGVTAGAGFYVRAITGSGGPSSGAYGLLVNFSDQPIETIQPPDTTVPEGESMGGSSNLDQGGKKDKDKEKKEKKDNHGKSRGHDDGYSHVEEFRIGHIVAHGDVFTIEEIGHHVHTTADEPRANALTDQQIFLVIPDPTLHELVGLGATGRTSRPRRLPAGAVDALMSRFVRH